MGAHVLDAAERDQLAKRGYVVRERAFDAAELGAIRASCESLVQRVSDAAGLVGPKVAAGSYLFQANRDLCTIVKWEPEQPDAVQGVEPFAHFDAALRRVGLDARFTDPMQDLLATPAVSLFTEKLTLKRARVGGPIVLHQDYPYWVDSSEDPGAIATAVLFLDDADRRNGCLEVVPGSHLGGVRDGKTTRGFAKFEMNPRSAEVSQLVSLEVPAGSIVFFGSLLVHRSTPNLSERDRRALLYSYQPPGRRHSVLGLAKLFGVAPPDPGD
jgi:ectoine hydroxylase